MTWGQASKEPCGTRVPLSAALTLDKHQFPKEAMDGRLQGVKRMLTGIASKLVPPFAPPATGCFPSNPCAPASIWKDGGNKVVTAQVL